jgi:hypothetical protein
VFDQSQKNGVPSWDGVAQQVNWLTIGRLGAPLCYQLDFAGFRPSGQKGDQRRAPS